MISPSAAGLHHRQRRLGTLSLLAALALAVLPVMLLGDYFDARRRAEPPERVLYLPKGKSLNYMSLGYRGVAADMVWIRGVLYVGRKLIKRQRRYDWMEKLYEVTTDLDPHWVRPYYVGGILLSALPQEDERALRLMDKGLRNNPWNPRAPFQAAQLHLYRGRTRRSLGQLKLIDRCMRPHPRTAGGRPPLDAEEHGILKQVPLVIQALQVEGGDYRAAVSTAHRHLSSTDDRVLREVAGRGYREALARLLEYELSGAAACFRGAKGRAPKSLAELMGLPARGRLRSVRDHFLKRMTRTLHGDRVMAGQYLAMLPRDPLGMELYLRPDGTVHSRGLERLELHRLLRTLNTYAKQFRRERGRAARSPLEFEEYLKALAETKRLPPGVALVFGSPPRLPEHPLGKGAWRGATEFSWGRMLNSESGELVMPPGPDAQRLFAAPLPMPPGPRERAKKKGESAK